MMFWIVIVLAFLFFLGLVSVLVFIADAAFGGEDFSTSKLVVERVAGIIQGRHLENGQLLDLGSCRGKFAVRLHESLPKLRILGIDGDWFRVSLAKMRSLFFKNLIFQKGNIFNADLSHADIIYIYLPQELMPKLENKLGKELKPGALVISQKVNFPNWQPQEIFILHKDRPAFEKLFIYQIA